MSILSYACMIVLVGFAVFVLSRFRPAPTQRIDDGMFSIRSGNGNFYAFDTGKGVALFDTGMSPKVAASGLRAMGMSPDAVTHIFLTHSDRDHAGGAKAFPAAMLYISKEEEQMVDGRTPRQLGFLHNQRMAGYHALEDGDAVDIGGAKVRMLLTPGHTPGSASFAIDGRFIACGDLLRVAKDGSLLPFLRFIDMDHRRSVESLRAAKQMVEGMQVVMTGHTGFRKKDTTE